MEFNQKYLSARRLDIGVLGYGLSRRTAMLISTIEALLPIMQRPQLDVVDFGCADAAMMKAIAQALGDRHNSSTGLDVFRAGAPEDGDGMRFLGVDLFKEYPYPIDDAGYDIAVASAFMKHHPDTQRFLSEVERILRPGGYAILLDPRPFVVRLGMIFGKFSRDYNPSLWSEQSVTKLVSESGIGLSPERYTRYWVAPVRTIYETGIEKLLPGWLINMLALHQCMVLQRTSVGLAKSRQPA